MKEHTQAISNEVSQLAEDARALLIATSDVAGDAVTEARKRLSLALDRGKQLAHRIEDEALNDARYAVRYIVDRPVQSIVIGLSIGAIIGCIMACRCPRKQD